MDRSLQGAVSCGCFGRVVVNPWLVFGIDVAVVSMLLVVRPSVREVWKDGSTLRRSFARPAALAVVMLALIGIVGGLAFGSGRAIIARLRGEAVGMDREVYDAGRHAPGSVLTFPLTVSNWSGEAVSVYGGSSDCSSRIETPLPVTIESGASVVISVQLRLPEASGVLRKRFHLLTDHRHARRIACTLACTSASLD